MKEIKAYIQVHKLSEVTSALHGVEGLTGMSIVDCRGFGTGWSSTRDASGSDTLSYRKGVKIEVCCRDELVDDVVAAIQNAAHTSLKGDGKIYVADIDHAVRISTGETGESAV